MIDNKLSPLLGFVFLLFMQLNGASASSSSAAPSLGSSSSAEERPSLDMFEGMSQRDLDLLSHVDPIQAYLYLCRYIMPKPLSSQLFSFKCTADEQFKGFLELIKAASLKEEPKSLFAFKNQKEAVHVYLKWTLLDLPSILAEEGVSYREEDLHQFLKKALEEPMLRQRIKVMLFIGALINQTGKSVDFDLLKKEKQKNLDSELEFLMSVRTCELSDFLTIVQTKQPTYSCEGDEVLKRTFKKLPDPSEKMLGDAVSSVCKELLALDPTEDDKGKDKAS